MKKYVKRSLIFLGITAGLAVLLIIGTLFYIKTDNAQKIIQKKINLLIPGTVSWKLEDISFFKGSVEAKNIILKGPEKNKLISVDRLYLEISPYDIFSGKLYIKNLDLESPQIWIKQDKDGNLDILKAFPQGKKEPAKSSSGSVPPVNIALKSLKITDGSLNFNLENENPDSNGKIDLKKIKILVEDGDLAKMAAKAGLEIGRGNMAFGKIKTGLDNFSIKARLENNDLKDIFIKFSSDLANLTLKGALTNIFEKPGFGLDMNMACNLLKLKKALDLKQKLSGDVLIGIKAKGRPDDPALSFNLEYQGGNIEGIDIGSVFFNGSLEKRVFKILKLNIASSAGHIDISGNADLKPAFPGGFITNDFSKTGLIAYDLIINQYGTLLDRLPVKIAGLKGKVKSRIEIKGRGFSPSVMWADGKVTVNGTGIALDKVLKPVPVNLKTDISLKNAVASVSNMRINSGKTRIDGNLSYGFDSEAIGGKLKAEISDLKDALSPLGIEGAEGSLKFLAKISGTVKKPIVKLDADGEKLGFNDISTDRLAFKGNLNEKGELIISGLDILSKRSRISAKGYVGIFDENMAVRKNPGFDLKIDAAPIYLSDFIKDFKGRLSIKANVKGSVKKPEGLVAVRGKAIDLKMQKIDNLEAKLNLDGRKIRIESLAVRPVKNQAIIARGWVSPFDMNYDLSLYTKKISLKNLGFLPRKKLKDEILVFDFKGKGNFKNPAMKGKILLTGLKVNNKKIDDLDFYLDLKNNFAKITGNPGFKIDGGFDLKKKDFSVFLKFDNISLGPYFELAGKTGFKGELDGRIEAKGNIEALDKIKAKADIAGLNLFMDKTELVRSRNIKLLFENRNIFVKNMNLGLLKKGYLNIKGSGKIGGNLDFTAKGEIPLEVAAAFSEDIQDIKGGVKISGFVKGTASNPDFAADISLNNVGFAIPVLFQKLHDLNGNIKLRPDFMVIDKMQGMIDDGKFDMGGKIELVKFAPSKINISFNAHTLPVNFPETVNVLLNTGIKFEGTPGKSKLSGKITILEGLYYKDMGLNLLEAVKKKRSSLESSPPEAGNPFIDNMEIDIAIRYKLPFVIDNNLALMSLKPHLDISGKLAKPVVKGRVAVESGTIKYQEHEFEISEGIIDFINPYRIDPDIRLKSEAVIRKWTINLEISGTTDNLKFILTANPYLEHEDIISLIVFGKTAKELINSDGGSSFSATQVLANIVADKLKDKLQDATGLDIVELNYKEGEEPDDTDEVDVMLGKQLSRRLAVKYGVETRKGEMIQKAVTEYKFLEQFFINAFQDTAGDFGGELVYRIDFR